MRLKELGGAAVEADGLALAEVALAVRLVNALEGADLDHAVCLECPVSYLPRWVWSWVWLW